MHRDYRGWRRAFCQSTIPGFDIKHYKVSPRYCRGVTRNYGSNFTGACEHRCKRFISRDGTVVILFPFPRLLDRRAAVEKDFCEDSTMTELLHYKFKTIWDDGNFILSQATLPEETSPILVVNPTLAQPTPVSIAQLEHAYALRGELDAAWAARPFELVRHQGQPALLMEHPGGELLAAMLGTPWELTQFLRVAIGLAVSLCRLHEHGLVHKDIKPANILVNKATGEVWLMGFGMPSRLVRERQAPHP